jgi:hypothetical protein
MQGTNKFGLNSKDFNNYHDKKTPVPNPLPAQKKSRPININLQVNNINTIV